METKEKRKVTFDPDVEQTYLLDGKWSFLRYFVLISKDWVVMTSMTSLTSFIRRAATKKNRDKAEH